MPFQFQQSVQKGSSETSKFKEKPRIIIIPTTTYNSAFVLLLNKAIHEQFQATKILTDQADSLFQSLEKLLSSVYFHGVFEQGNGSTCLS